MALPLRRLQGAKTCPVLPASRDPLFSPRLAREISHTMSRVRETGHMERFGRRVQPQRVSPAPCRSLLTRPLPSRMVVASCARLREITHNKAFFIKKTAARLGYTIHKARYMLCENCRVGLVRNPEQHGPLLQLELVYSEEAGIRPGHQGIPA